MFKDLKHRIKRYLRVGASSDSDQDDTNFYRCRVCGHVCDFRKVEILTGGDERIVYKDGNVYTTDSDGDNVVQPTTGCPQCGTFYSR